MSDSVSPGVKDKVLFVDDEPHLLAAIQRGLRNQFEIHVATGGREALEMLQKSGPFPLVVSDMRMPQMSGVQLLAQVRQRYPDTVRMIFSGQSDLPETIAAVNEGNIFRFLSKPCGTGALLAAVQCGLQQYRLLSAEKVLLEQTLSGCVGMLVEILSMVMPAAHSRALRLQRYVLALATALGLPPQWQWPLAAVLSQIGCVSLPRETLARAEAGQPLNEEERTLYDSHPQLARKLLEGIPRLEDVAAIVAAQMQVPGSPSITGDRESAAMRCAHCGCDAIACGF
jgi:response regulator RpfG family c-di-GMP phosphodiesterase